jgi:hypothetical protein
MPVAESQLTLDIRGVKIRLDLPGPGWMGDLRDRYADFLTPDAPDWCVRIVHAPPQGDRFAGQVHHLPTVTRFRVGGSSGVIDLEHRVAKATTHSKSRAANAFERVASFLCMQVLPREHQSLWLHGVGINLDGLGIAFCGPSGAGKTTIARLADGHAQVLCDENIIAAIGSSDARLASTPFWGFSTPPHLVRRVKLSVPFAALVFLEHAPAFELIRLSVPDTISQLLLTEKVAVERVSSADAWLSVAGALALSVPAYVLRFPPSEAIWSFLRSRLSPVGGTKA